MTRTGPQSNDGATALWPVRCPLAYQVRQETDSPRPCLFNFRQGSCISVTKAKGRDDLLCRQGAVQGADQWEPGPSGVTERADCARGVDDGLV
jgi:hypothetical protein